MKFGGRMYHRNILFTDARSHNGVYGFTGVMTQRPTSSAGTGVSFADYLLGYPANATRSNPATWWGGTGTYWHGFIQDDYRLTDNLTVNLGLRVRVHAVAHRLSQPGRGVRPDASEVDHRVERDRSDRPRRAAPGRCRLSAFRRLDSNQQSGGRAAAADEKRYQPVGAARRLCLSPRRSHGRSRRLRHVLRSRRHERSPELPLPAVQPQRGCERGCQRGAGSHAGELFPRRPVRCRGRNHRMESSDARRASSATTSAGTSASSAKSPRA